LTWAPQTGATVEYRVLKQGPAEQKPEVAATVKTPEYIDNRAVFGQTYQYSVQAFIKSGSTEAQSALSEPVSITPEDRFPPAVPSGVGASRGISSIELSWDPVPDTDLRGYYVYRAAGDGALQRLGELLIAPAYSDRAVESGRKYRYAISAIDRAGNESAQSSTVEATAP
jgi:fibronectin type 3 domain-containing protein